LGDTSGTARLHEYYEETLEIADNNCIAEVRVLMLGVNNMLLTFCIDCTET
jgi:hypothetical protein